MMRKHERFILTPITQVLEEAQFVMLPLENNIDNYPVFDYIMQSLFLKMTGFQEQKMKCISWELATDDYGLRYERYKKSPLGECSSYKDKLTVFQDLVNALEKLQPGSSVLTEQQREAVLAETKNILWNLSKKSPMRGWAEKDISTFNFLFSKSCKNCVLYVNKGRAGDILGHCDNCAKKSGVDACPLYKFGTLKNVYEVVIQHRNRCAHNISSFQQNLPSLVKLQKNEYVLENYFVRFALLIVIDKVFVALFSKYLELQPESFQL